MEDGVSVEGLGALLSTTTTTVQEALNKASDIASPLELKPLEVPELETRTLPALVRGINIKLNALNDLLSRIAERL